MPEPVVLSWSGGKDCSFALYEMQKDPSFRIKGLLTTLSRVYDRISMHGVRRELLEMQVRETGQKLNMIFLPEKPDNETYQRLMHEKMQEYTAEGIKHIAFADLFVEDIKAYREEQMKKAGMQAVFPLWRRNTSKLALEFIDKGFKAIVSCVDTTQLHTSFAGRQYNKNFLDALPAGVDPCGENGEFHTFVYDGPLFKNSLKIKTGDMELRDQRFYFCDLKPNY